MKRPIEPVRPNKPITPRPPQKYYYPNKEIEITGFETVQDIINMIPEGCEASYINLDVRAYKDMFDDAKVDVKLVYTEQETENECYDEQFDLYLKKVEEYKEEMKKYDKDMKKYKKDFEMYKYKMKEFTKTVKIKEIEALENKIEKIKSELDT